MADRKNKIQTVSGCRTALRFLVLLAMLAGLFLTGPAVHAEDSRVFDYYDLLTDSEEETLQEVYRQFETENDIIIFLVTADNSVTGGSSDSASSRYLENFNDETFGANAIGLLINMESRYIYVDVAGEEALRVFTDSRQGEILDSVLEELYEEDYQAAGEVFAKKAGEMIYRAENTSGSGSWDGDYGYGELVEEPYMKAHFGIDPVVLAVAAVLAAIITAFIFYTLYGKHKEKHEAYSAAGYIVPGTVRMHVNRDVFIRQYITRVPRPQPTENRGGGGGSRPHTTVHHSSGGHMHSGSGRHF